MTSLRKRQQERPAEPAGRDHARRGTRNSAVFYRAHANVGEDCRLDFAYYPGTVFAQIVGGGAGNLFIGCGDADLVEPKTLVKGNVIMMSIAMDSVPKEMKQFGELKDMYAFTQTSEPLTGIIGNGDLDVTNTPVPTDSAETDKKFKFV